MKYSFQQFVTFVFREQHIYTKIDLSKRDAIMKKQKKDQKGVLELSLLNKRSF